MASDRAIDSATVLASVSYALSERDSEIGRLRRRSDKQYTDRRLLLWLHAEAVHKLGLDTARVEHAHDEEELRRQLLDVLGDDAQTEAALRVVLPVLVAHEYTEDQALAELDAVKAKVKADVGWNEAIDWLLNSRHTADPDIQSAFWGMAEGRFTRKQADTGCFQYDDEGNAYIPTDDEQPDTEATEQAPREPRHWYKHDEPPPLDVKKVRHDNSQVFTRVGPNGWRADAGRVITGEQLIARLGGYKLTEVTGDGGPARPRAWTGGARQPDGVDRVQAQNGHTFGRAAMDDRWYSATEQQGGSSFSWQELLAEHGIVFEVLTPGGGS
jgi:hypothetical protein